MARGGSRFAIAGQYQRESAMPERATSSSCAATAARAQFKTFIIYSGLGDAVTF
jgi:hypothetical protein